MFVNCSVFCNVQHVQSSILDQNVMFEKFDIWTFSVRSVQSSVFWCSFQNDKIRSISKRRTQDTLPYFVEQTCNKSQISKNWTLFGVANLFPCHFKSTTKNERIFFCTKKHRPYPIDPLTPSLLPAFGILHLWLAPWCSPSLLFDPGLICNIVESAL